MIHDIRSETLLIYGENGLYIMTMYLSTKEL